ncbi:hypothetical protein M9458_000322, partial [Cirrhinus mrigala]
LHLSVNRPRERLRPLAVLLQCEAPPLVLLARLLLTPPLHLEFHPFHPGPALLQSTQMLLGVVRWSRPLRCRLDPLAYRPLCRPAYL